MAGVDDEKLSAKSTGYAEGSWRVIRVNDQLQFFQLSNQVDRDTVNTVILKVGMGEGLLTSMSSRSKILELR